MAEASAVEAVLAGAEIRLVGLEGMISSEFRMECEEKVWDDRMMTMGWGIMG